MVAFALAFQFYQVIVTNIYAHIVMYWCCILIFNTIKSDVVFCRKRVVLAVQRYCWFCLINKLISIHGVRIALFFCMWLDFDFFSVWDFVSIQLWENNFSITSSWQKNWWMVSCVEWNWFLTDWLIYWRLKYSISNMFCCMCEKVFNTEELSKHASVAFTGVCLPTFVGSLDILLILFTLKMCSVAMFDE